MGDEQYEVWLHGLKDQALQAALAGEGLSVEQKAQQLLDDCYERLVPPDVRQTIEVQIAAECAEHEKAAESARRFAALRITEGGHTAWFEYENYRSPVFIARICRDYLSQEPTTGDGFAKRLHDTTHIGELAYMDHWDAIGKDQRIEAVLDVDFDDGTLGIMLPDDARMRTYSMKDVSTAAYHAFRKEIETPSTRESIFTEHLAGKEIEFEDPMFSQVQDMTMG